MTRAAPMILTNRAMSSLSSSGSRSRGPGELDCEPAPLGRVRETRRVVGNSPQSGLHPGVPLEPVVQDPTCLRAHCKDASRAEDVDLAQEPAPVASHGSPTRLLQDPPDLLRRHTLLEGVGQMSVAESQAPEHRVEMPDGGRPAIGGAWVGADDHDPAHAAPALDAVTLWEEPDLPPLVEIYVPHDSLAKSFQ